MMRPTRRGLGAVTAVIAAAAMAWLFGARSLNAVATPAAVALLAGVVQVAIASEPSVERAPLSPAFPGETRTVSLSIEGGSTVVDVTERVSADVTANAGTATVAPPATVTYDLRCDQRGEHAVGPTTVRIRDVLGLFERSVTADTETTQVVYPPVHAIEQEGPLAGMLAQALSSDREAFEGVREYVPGDPLRDVHWNSSAKRPGKLIVTEFAGREPTGSVAIAAEASPGMADEMAAATASLAVALLEAGVAVDVYVPDDSVASENTLVDRTAVLSMLARTTHGEVAEEVRTDADVLVKADQFGDVTVAVGERATTFERLRTGEIERTGDGTKVVSAP
jgi:uncharacterized protein (DUF58 family)